MSGGSTSGTPPTSANLGGITLTVPAGGTSSTTSPYGLTDGWGTQPINLSGFPATIVADLAKAGLDTSQPQPGNVVAAAIAKLPSADTQLIQQMLYYGGWYTGISNITDLHLGSFQDKDIAALKNLIQTGGQTGQPLGSYLVASANYGQAQGTINQVAGVGVKPIPIPADVDVDTALRAAAEKELGHDPSPELLAGFRAMYDQMLVTASKQAQALAAQSTATNLGDPEQIGAAAGRLGLSGYFGDAAQAPPMPGANGGSAPTQADARASQLPGTLGTTQADSNESQIEDNYNAYQQQHAADQNTVNQFQSAANSNLAGATPTLTSAPDINDAAEQYIQQNDAAGVGQQDTVSKYSTLLSILSGGGK
jgi:hypothetical protein